MQATAPETGSAGRLGDRQTDGRTARRAPSRPAGTCGSRTGRTASAGRAGWTSPSHRRSRQLDPPRKEKRGASGSGACVTAPATPRPACWCVCGGEGGAAEAVGVAARAALAVTPVARRRPGTALVARGVQELLLSLGDTRGLGGQGVQCGVGGPSGCASAASSPRAPPFQTAVQGLDPRSCGRQGPARYRQRALLRSGGQPRTGAEGTAWRGGEGPRRPASPWAAGFEDVSLSRDQP